MGAHVLMRGLRKWEHCLHYLALGAAFGQELLLMVLYSGARGEMARIVAAGLIGVVAGLLAVAARPVRRRAHIRFHVRRHTRDFPEGDARRGWRRESTRTENPGGGSGDAQ